MAENKEPLIVPINQLLPPELFILPVRHRPVFPGMVTPLVIAEGRLAEAIENVHKQNQYLGLVLQHDDTSSEVGPDQLYRVGTAAKILKRINLPEGGMHLLVNSLERFRIQSFVHSTPQMLAKVEYQIEATQVRDKELIALMRSVLNQAKEMMTENPYFTEEMKLTLINVEEPGKIADFVSSVLNLKREEFQEILETFDIRRRLERVLQFLARELDLVKLQRKIQGKVNQGVEHNQREYYLREQLKAIKSELRGPETRDKDGDYYRQKIEAAKLPAEANERALDECGKLDYIEPSSHEYTVIRNYLDTILDLPWNIPAVDDIDLSYARQVLNRDHFGLDDVKTRILEYLAVRSLKSDVKGSIICLVGPPGVGKTSLGKSIAAAMKKKFYRFSLGGMRDEAEIKGHRRTYIGAMPGKLIQGLKSTKAKDMVLMLDEIDKLGRSYHGDPASALLEVLDPAQNSEFRDHFLDLPFDLSQITFITTANSLDSIPEPLLDRMEVIRLPGYILEEKLQIAKKYLVGRAIADSGLTKKNAPQLSLTGLRFLIDGYAREAGVRRLEREIQKLYRKAAAALVEKKPFAKTLTPKEIPKYLGKPVFTRADELTTLAVGSAIGLAYTAMGGATLTIESRKFPGRGKVKFTGQIGKVMNESAEIAVSFARSLENDDRFWGKHDIHIHVPDGATPKDGPSAGITITTALLSLLRNQKIKSGYAMTGEIRLSGDVLPIGGLREKIVAARRVGIRNVIFPYDNLRDYEELPGELRKGLKIFAVKHYSEIEQLLFSRAKKSNPVKKTKAGKRR
ncbi:MAG TPA: endopeptidase La [Turneriella sp.]|nr:endopeptidase La [Turneriella sp.]HNL09622.1 endopeptidase La [Turneriella sp.]